MDTNNTSTRDDRADLVAGLRALADDIESSDGPLPTHPVELKWLLFWGEGQKETATAVVRSLGGRWDKRDCSEFFRFTRQYGPSVTAEVVVDRVSVCERVVTGSETVTIPATEAVPAMPAQTKTVEKVEWRCMPLLAAVDEAVLA